MVTVVIYSKRGRRFFRITRGRVFCNRGGKLTAMRRSCGYSGPLADGSHKIALTALGYDSCDSVR